MKQHPYRPALVLAAILLAARAAFAEPSPPPTGDKDKAREWAEKASQRFDAGDYASAVEAIREAEKHYRAPTFAKLRADALEKLGRLVEARDAYRSIAEWDLPPSAAQVWIDAKNGAPARVAALDGRIPKLVVVVEGTPPVTLDGASLPDRMRGVLMPLDPGKHIVVAGEGAAAARREVVLKEGATERLTVSAPPQAGARVGAAPLVAAFGVGVAGLLAGAIFGGLAAGKKGEVLTGVDDCGDACTAAEKVRLEGVLSDAGVFANVSTAGFVVAGVGAAAGATLLVLSRRGDGAGPTVRITMGSISLSGSF